MISYSSFYFTKIIILSTWSKGSKVCAKLSSVIYFEMEGAIFKGEKGRLDIIDVEK